VIIQNRVQGWCKLNAESLLFAEARPILADDSLKSGAKVLKRLKIKD